MISTEYLSQIGITVSLSNHGRLKLSSSVPPSREVIDQIRQFKPAIIRQLQSQCSHNDPAKWHDQPCTNRPGWTQTTCKLCGRFIGNRPSQ